ncbi:DUF192 domain-containing protein [Comamonas sp. Y33R10-2]|uniref:DUF192 domain-containing protein n=1 Tax=Comamonas sp. Y33R10-2 TaxID=2853257 RepID=UPI001C5C9BA2|nr:DUF192 domain-containing protein [Comamonas sp. Y33R10-2]QXZ10890.1 DUF192 domain-containing protein [Comamonas sp. Y33R10-2]
MKNSPSKISHQDLPQSVRAKWVAVVSTALLAFASLGSMTPAMARDEGQPQMNLRRIDLTAGMFRINTQLAQTPQQREIGLMFRKEMPQQEGMLFIFDVPGVQCFWMRNTLLPLTAAFVADDGTIVNLADMKPMSDDSHCSAKPVRYVLEMNVGWFAKRGIKAGAKLGGEPFKQ